MAFFGTSTGPDSYVARGALVGLRPLLISDFAAWADLRAVSKEHLIPYEPTWLHDELQKSSYRRRVRHYQRELRDDVGYSFAIARLGDDTLIGGVSLTNVRRGVTQTASLGYWLGKPHVGRGYMADAVSAIIPYAVYGIRLHRIEAATLPDNERSINVLERNGFQREGYARHYLKINGSWRDHILFGLTAEDLQSPAVKVAQQSEAVAL